MLTLGSLAHQLHIARCVGKQRQDSSIKVSYQKQENGWGQKLGNDPQYYPTVVYGLSRNAYHGGSHPISLIPIGQSQIPRQKSSKTSAPTLQLLANDSNKHRGRTNSTTNNGSVCLRKHSSEYIRNDSNRRYSLDNVIKQRKIEEIDKKNPAATSTFDIKKEVSFISITNKDGNFPKRPWHDANFDVNQNAAIANSTCNKYTERNQEEPESAKDVPNGSLEKQDCSAITNIDETKTMRMPPESVSQTTIAPFKPSSPASFYGRSPTRPLTKPHSSKLRDSTDEQNMQVTYPTNCSRQLVAEMKMPTLRTGERLGWHLQIKPNAIETQQKNKKILQVAPPNHGTLMCSSLVKTKLEQNNSNERNNSETRGDEGQKVSFQSFRQRLYKQFEKTSPDINEKMKIAFAKTPLPSKMGPTSLQKRNSCSSMATALGKCAHPTAGKSEPEGLPFNPMYTTQISRYNRSHADENCEKEKNNGLLSLNSKNLTLFEIFSSKSCSQINSKNKRIYTWLEDCRRHAREKLFIELDAKIKNC